MKKFILLLLLSISAALCIGQEMTAEDAQAQINEHIQKTSNIDKARVRVIDKAEILLEQASVNDNTKQRALLNIKNTRSLMKLFGLSKKSFGDGSFFGITNYSLAACAIVLFVYLIIGFIVTKLIFNLTLRALHAKNVRLGESLISGLRAPILTTICTLAIYQALQYIAVELDILSLYENTFTVLILFCLLWIVLKVYDMLSEIIRRHAPANSGFREVIPIFLNSTRWIIISCAILYAIHRLGGDVSGIMVSLGIGGAALAFASKDTIANFFGSMSLVVDAPFKIGDRIQVASKFDGVVESIGIRSTRIRNLDDTLSILPNSYLANEYIINVSKWTKRKVTLQVGVLYSTSVEQIDSLIADIKTMLTSDSSIMPDPIVAFEDFDDSSLRIKIIYFSKYTDAESFFGLVTTVNKQIVSLVKKNGTDFAYPTRTVLLEK